jgi:hypothetical protein
MDMMALFFVSLLIAGSVIYLVTHAPVISKTLGKTWSPRLTLCKVLVPMDVVLTITLVIGPMFTGISGIMAFVAGGFTAAGLSLGVFFVKKALVPRWRRQYQELKHPSIAFD